MKRPPQRRVYETVREKRAWQEPPGPAEAALEVTIGSKGWHTRGYLPHFDKPGVLQMVTFRLADAMPAARRHEWEALFAIKDEREQRTRLEAYLDRGYGECLLNDPRLTGVVEEVMLFRDNQDYRLAAWVVMPNHVHVLFEQWTVPLGEVLKSWKGVSAWALNQLLDRTGDRWQADYWDRFVRDEAHSRKVQHYIEWNPVKAGLERDPAQWPFSSLNPRWQWSGPDRYRCVQLLNPPAEWTVPRLKAAKKANPSADRSTPRSADTPVRFCSSRAPRRTRVSALRGDSRAGAES